MPNVYADKIKAQTMEPWVINPKTVDNYHDNTSLPLTSLSQADNIILDDGLIEKVPGTVKISAGTISAASVMGLHRTYSPAGTKIALKLYNGTLYSASAPSATSKFATSVLTNLATNKRTPWVDIKGKAYGVNEIDGILRYDAKTATGLKIGMYGPYLRKKIAFFEDDETWTTTNAGSQSTAVFRPEEWSGDASRSLRLYCSAASSRASASCNIPLNLTTFDDGKAVTDDDYITLHTFHGNRVNISCARIHFSTGGTDFTNYYSAYLDQELFEAGDHEWTKWNIRRGAFTTGAGSPDWSKVSAVRITAESNTSGATDIHFDQMYLKATPIKSYNMMKRVFTCEGIGETWTGKNDTFDYKYQHEGLRSVRLTGAGATSAVCTLTTPVDLSKWGDGAATNASDELIFHLRTNNIAKVSAANVLVLRLGTDASNYTIRTWGTLSALGLTGSNQWTEIRVPKGRISAAGAGSFSAMSAVGYIGFITGAIVGTNYLDIDDCYLEPKIDAKVVCDMEAATQDHWTITGNGDFIKDPQGKGKVTEGTYALRLWASKSRQLSESYAVYDISAATGSVANLTAWTDGGNSDTNDEISFSLFHTKAPHIEYVELWFDNNSTNTFAAAYKYRITKDMFAGAGAKNNVGKEISIKKSDFEEIGTGGAWSTIGAVKFYVYGKGTKDNSAVILDNLILTRKVGVSGRYYYKTIFRVNDVASAASEPSDYIDARGTKVALTNVPTSQDSRVTSREIYRMGGSYPDTWGLVKVIEDNTTTEILDDVDDEDITYFLDTEGDVPDGWVNYVTCNNVVYDPYSDRALYWGDPTYKNRVYFSHVGFYHVVDEAGYREFPDDVMNVVPWFGQTIIFYKHGIQKIVDGDITTGQLIEMPIEKGACSYWAVAPAWKGLIPYVSMDNVCLFDGTRSIDIGDEVKGYFKGRESYLSTVNVGLVKDTLYIACKDKTGTPTYNDTVLRYYLPTKSWTVLPDWNVNFWSNWDKQDDQNEMHYGDSVTGDVYKINDTGWLFGASNIAVDFDTGWLSEPDADIAIQRIEFKAKGTASSTLTFNGYINNGASATTTGEITLTTAWQVFRLGPKGIMDLLKGNNVKIEFTQSAQNAYFKMKDIVVYYEKLPERVSITTANEVSCAAP